MFSGYNYDDNLVIKLQNMPKKDFRTTTSGDETETNLKGEKNKRV